MCLIGVALGASTRFPLVLAANRDEFFVRPTLGAHWWNDHPDVLAGRDLRAGGTWLGVTRTGKLAAVTNIHRPNASEGTISRGDLVTAFLNNSMSASEYTTHVLQQRKQYSPFNLFVCAGSRASYLNQDGDCVKLDDGVHAISNTPIGDDWPKTRLMREGLTSALHSEDISGALLELLSTEGSDATPADLQTDLFIRGKQFGTRSTTVVVVSNDGMIHFTERQFDAGANVQQEVRFRVPLEQ